MTCPAAAQSLGAYALGALEPEERRLVEEHVRRCPACAVELAEFRTLPPLLARVDPDDLRDAAVTPSPDLFARVSAAAAAEESAQNGRTGPRGSRRRLLVVAALAVVLGGAVAGGTWVAATGEQAHTAAVGAVQITVTAERQDVGTALGVSVAGLPPHQVCRLVVVDRDGDRHLAGEWTATRSGEAWFRGWTDVDRTALSNVLLVGKDGEELIRVAV
jgi:anti-sigma factor RsiW